MTNLNVGDTALLVMSKGKPKVKLLSFHSSIKNGYPDGFNIEYLEAYDDWKNEGDRGWAEFNKLEAIAPTPAQVQEDADIDLDIVIRALMFTALYSPDGDEAEIFLSYARELLND